MIVYSTETETSLLKGQKLKLKYKRFKVTLRNQCANISTFSFVDQGSLKSFFPNNQCFSIQTHERKLHCHIFLYFEYNYWRSTGAAIYQPGHEVGTVHTTNQRSPDASTICVNAGAYILSTKALLNTLTYSQYQKLETESKPQQREQVLARCQATHRSEHWTLGTVTKNIMTRNTMSDDSTIINSLTNLRNKNADSTNDEERDEWAG